ncbi:MAG: hypothetical protein FI707_12410 [SAR202 cluster bacterium]|nr:hypothetical protein [Chloroflexota bacterium]MQG59636.1 hypothetical protein [SAR202 cluster bacterium]MQG69580.1 hypothetical protein [SAR202 cluster bacterium]HAL47944.1 hypothetical protein [Dehalococcoidia bacterium]|tara:strand:+ start:2887 stop:3327 length:441 start_codon:yes stop_codon:yes gene_type:complete
MIPPFQNDGNLPPGIHWATWDEIVASFGATAWRQALLNGLKAALEEFRRSGCQTFYIDGSFVTEKDDPGDFDACWENAGVDPTVLDPVLLTFDRGRATQKAKYRGEMFPASAEAIPGGRTFFEFFQIDKDTGDPKGIIALDLGGLK